MRTYSCVCETKSLFSLFSLNSILKKIREWKEVFKNLNGLPNEGSLSIDKSCFVKSKEFKDGLQKGIDLCASCAPGALLCELFEPNDDVGDSDSLLPF